MCSFFFPKLNFSKRKPSAFILGGIFSLTSNSVSQISLNCHFISGGFKIAVVQDESNTDDNRRDIFNILFIFISFSARALSAHGL